MKIRLWIEYTGRGFCEIEVCRNQLGKFENKIRKLDNWDDAWIFECDDSIKEMTPVDWGYETIE